MLIFYTILIIIERTTCSEDEYRLLQDLRENYDKVERPVLNHTASINVNVRAILQQIVDVVSNDFLKKQLFHKL